MAIDLARRGQAARHRVFPDLLRRPVRRDARQARAAAAIGAMAESGAGFAGFATWFDMTPADPDVFAIPDPVEPDPAALEARGRLAGGRLLHGRRGGGAGAAQHAAPRDRRGRGGGLRMKHGVECEFHLIDARAAARSPTRATPRRSPATTSSALMRRYDVIREICDAMLGARLGRLPERPRGRQRPVRDELGLRRRADHRRPPRLLQVHGQVHRREARPARDLHAEALRRADRQRLPRPCQPVGRGRRDEPVRRRRRRAGAVGARLPLSRRAARTRAGARAPTPTRRSTATSGSTRRARLPARPGRPTPITYGGNNRTHMVRIPEGGRLELRLADGAANPYLLPGGHARRRARRDRRGARSRPRGSTSTCTSTATRLTGRPAAAAEPARRAARARGRRDAVRRRLRGDDARLRPAEDRRMGGLRAPSDPVGT